MLGLVCIDVDGTLVGTGGVVQDRVWQAAGRARAAGMHLALCSGRPALSLTREYAVRLDPQGWHIFQNGASIVNVGTGESSSAAFPEGALAELVERSRRTGRLLEVYTDHDYAVERDTDLARRHAELLALPFVTRDLLALPGRVVRLQWVVPRNEAATVMAEPHEGLTLHPAGSPVMPDTLFISITRAGVDKGSAIRQIAGAYGVPLEQTMMVGDGHNDVLAMQAVTYRVAMRNADPEARAAANHFVGHVDEGGLADAIDLAMTL